MARQNTTACYCSIAQHSSVTRRHWLKWSLALAATPMANARLSFPGKPVQVIVPWPAGGQTDLTMRILAEEAAPLLGQPVVIVNKPGAAGTLVVPLLKAAEPDGHTIGQVPITVYRHALMHHVAWDPVKDLAPIAQVSSVHFGLLVPSNSPFRSVADLIGWAVQHPGELILGSTGIGTTSHLAMEEILTQHNVKYVHVPYKGTADQMLAIATGQIMGGVNSSGFAPWVEKGQVRLLAIFSAARNPRWPDAPTMRELGYPQAVYTSPWGLAAPAGTPPSVIQILHGVFYKAMFSTRHIEALARFDQSLDYLNTHDYRMAVLATIEREKKLLARMNLLAAPAS
ncbi:Bug family tripartite tricarboxylate transporter substrate binding protein [Tepidimonas sp. HKU79]|uniref:Bug family tripartite tricarboxylate transporter substrate binding protein n=2 Tax=unclassified Tepidimonas TaxID=2631705 RepID=UPI003C7BAFE1